MKFIKFKDEEIRLWAQFQQEPILRWPTKFGSPLPYFTESIQNSRILRSSRSLNVPRKKGCASHFGLGFTFMWFSIAWPIVLPIRAAIGCCLKPLQAAGVSSEKAIHTILNVKGARYIPTGTISRMATTAYSIGMKTGVWKQSVGHHTRIPCFP